MDDIVIRECVTLGELDSCVHLQREVFGLPDLEVSPQRHLIVSRQAGGWTLGAFVTEAGQGSERLVGFVHHLAAVRGNEIFGYSHMMAVDVEYQNKGVGARLKWSQRERALEEGRSRIRWTWDPMLARNGHFNLNRLGVTVSSYGENFYGTDYVTSPTLGTGELPGIDSDRIFADWRIHSRRVMELANSEATREAKGESQCESQGESRSGAMATSASPAVKIVIPAEWTKLVMEDPAMARQEQLRVRSEFQKAFADGLIAAGFDRSTPQPRYLLYESQVLESFLSSEL